MTVLIRLKHLEEVGVIIVISFTYRKYTSKFSLIPAIMKDDYMSISNTGKKNIVFINLYEMFNASK